MPSHHAKTLTLLCYLGFIVYGSLIPFELRPMTLEQALAHFANIRYLQLGVGSRADLIANFVLYVPLGYLAAERLLGAWRSGAGRLAAAALVLAACAALAVGIEFTQLFFSPRTVSLNDLQSEALGSLTGILLWHVLGARARHLIGRLHGKGPAAVRALLVLYLLFYVAVSLFPYDFLLSREELLWKWNSDRHHPLIAAITCSAAAACLGKITAEVLAAVPLGLLLAISTRASLPRVLGLGLLAGVLIEGLQFFLASGISQGISALALTLGLVLGLALRELYRHNAMARLQRAPWLRPLAGGTALVYLALSAWLAWSDKGERLGLEEALQRLPELSFLPFYYHYYTSEPVALANLLNNTALYLPVGVLYWLWSLARWESLRWRTLLAALLGMLTAAFIETGKLFLGGTHPDPTNVLIAGVSAALILRVCNWALIDQGRSTQTARGPVSVALLQARAAGGRPLYRQLGAAACLLGLIVSVAAYRLQMPIERAVDESVMHKLPAPKDLPIPALPGFRHAHPRLPHPSAADIAQLRAENPQYFRQLNKRANRGAGNLHSSAILGFIEPGSVDLDTLFERLMALQFTMRGHEQTKPLAVAYDWLYPQWSEAQRQRLRDKLIEGCNYQIDFIRNERLSPYNVYLYNSPFQALMACAIAVYGEDPRAEPVMAFTADLWRQRVLPVWRQVMGQNGGWHEGGDYAATGIGQAIYQVPAMWRAATGEDLFASEPGIRGFLDYLVYRKRPDGQTFRWGDSSYVGRDVPDRLALALEYRHAAAYSLEGPIKRMEPTAWPWGPLPDATLYDPQAVARLPLFKYLDGIGMLVARSGWGPDATYLSFKTGDNFWSHSHLDQGAFTLYKGGPLAIDSGLYGPRYGSEHHMNYTYQTIAHNTVTVTDPDDTQHSPNLNGQGPAPVANDGGQRRIGSGWGVEPAPLDLAEWQDKRALYHTGRIERLFAEDGLVAAVADLTPAYTNVYSGQGTFSHRTRRVETFRRLFAYDRIDDVVVIFDRLVSTRPEFPKRWLLHSIEQPRVTERGFVVQVPPADGSGPTGGHLEGRVLLPAKARIQAIGGPGFEFLVDGVNYDEKGKVWEALRRMRGRPEPGAWRIELSPPAAAAEDHFLVVLVPSAADRVAPHRITPLTRGEEVGCEIAGPRRTTRWWFDKALHRVTIEVDGDGQRRIHEMVVP